MSEKRQQLLKLIGNSCTVKRHNTIGVPTPDRRIVSSHWRCSKAHEAATKILREELRYHRSSGWSRVRYSVRKQGFWKPWKVLER